LGAEIERRGVQACAAECLRAAREAGMFVVHGRVAFDDGYAYRTNRSASFAQYEDGGILKAGSPEAEIYHEVAPRPGEPVLDRGWVDPFIGSPLAGMLTARAVRAVYLGGVATNFVLESATRHAGGLDFDVRVVDGVCTSFTQELHDVAFGTLIPVWEQVIAAETVGEAC